MSNIRSRLARLEREFSDDDDFWAPPMMDTPEGLDEVPHDSPAFRRIWAHALRAQGLQVPPHLIPYLEDRPDESTPSP